jgi:hypothetical protein
MKHLHYLLSSIVVACALPSTVFGAVVVDDKWADGSRKEQKLPNESAWFTSNATNLAASAGKLEVWSSSSSRQFVTYFAPLDAPVSLAKTDDAITATIQFSPSGVADENSSHNLRFGLFDFSGGKRATADSTPAGKGVKGYALFLNFGKSFGTANALKINSRTNIVNTELLGASGAYNPLDSTGQPANHSPAFVNGASYSLQFSAKKTSDTTVEIKTIITGGSLGITNTGVDTGTSTALCTKFDGFAIRSYSGDATAARFDLTEFKVEGPGATVQANK